MTRKFAFGLVLAAALVGCGDDDGGGTTDSGPRTDTGVPTPPTPPGPDTGVPVPPTPPDPPGNETYDYVVNLLEIGQASASNPDEAPGYDLDDHNTQMESDPIGCGWTDFTAPAQFGGGAGVDNQLGPLLEMISSLGLDFDANGTIAENIAMGDLLLLIRVTGVGDIENDGNVTVQFFLGQLAEGQTPMVDGMMRLSGGQTFLVDPASVMGSLDSPRIQFSNAVIANGRLSGGPALFSLMVPLGDMGNLDLDVQEAQVGFDITETSLSNGLVGGFVDVDDIVTAITNLMLDIMIPVETVRSILEGQADIDGNGDTECEALSVGLVFNGVEATFTALGM